MSVTSVEKSVDALTVTWVANFDVSPVDLWKLWADPRLLERWMGPPTHPANVETHEFYPGGEVNYHMTSPTGEKHVGRWKIISVNPPASLDYVDGDDVPDGGMPITSWSMTLADYYGGTRMHLICRFASREHMDQLISMGTEEGHTVTIGQMDELLSELPWLAESMSLKGQVE